MTALNRMDLTRAKNERPRQQGVPSSAARPTKSCDPYNSESSYTCGCTEIVGLSYNLAKAIGKTSMSNAI